MASGGCQPKTGDISARWWLGVERGGFVDQFWAIRKMK